ncbi:c-type cytochrome [Pseudomonadota bacterium]
MPIYKTFWLAIVGFALIAGLVAPVHAVDSRKDVRKEVAVAKKRIKQSIRGALVYKTYCTLCHNEEGGGPGRAAKLYGELDLSISNRSAEYYENIIRKGGKAIGRSPFMPTWQDELSDEQIGDVTQYLSLINDPVGRGEIVYKTNCILCHGVKGNGKGRSSVLYDPPPANLTRSDKNDDYKRMIITQGGKAMGRSEVMPVWGEQISAREIDDVIAYLRTILVVPPPD